MVRRDGSHFEHLMNDTTEMEAKMEVEKRVCVCTERNLKK